MKHLNQIGASLAAIVSLSVLTACDSRGVTAMKSRTYTPEEIANEKLARQGVPASKRTDLPAQSTSPAATPATTKDGGKPADENVSDKEAGSAQPKLFTETKEGLRASKSALLLFAKDELGKISPGATDILKGITVVDQSSGGKPRLAFDAILMPDDRALEMHALFDVETSDTDVINSRPDLKVDDLSAVADADIAPSRVAVATVCSEVEGSICKKVILVFNVSYAKGSKVALVEVKLGGAGQVPNEVLVTNTGLLKSFKDAQTEFGAKMPDKTEAPKATIKPVAAVARPGVSFKDEVKSKDMKYKEFAARYAEWKKSQADSDKWSKHIRPTAKPETVAKPTEPTKVEAPAAPAAKPTVAAPQAATKATEPASMPSVEQMKLMTKPQIADALKKYEATSPVPLPQQARDAALKLGKGDPKTLVETPEQTEKKRLVAEKNEYDKLPWYKKPFTAWFAYDRGKAGLMNIN